VLGLISTFLFKSKYAPTITIFFVILSGITMLLLLKNPIVTVLLLLIYFLLLFGISNTLGRKFFVFLSDLKCLLFLWNLRN
jgi:hypothetical protein